jgi:hypothetical protein
MKFEIDVPRVKGSNMICDTVFGDRLEMRADQALAKELLYHADLLASDYARRGFPEKEAYRLARLKFGGVEQIKEACRDIRTEIVWSV